jgi:hypothetical protein
MVLMDLLTTDFLIFLNGFYVVINQVLEFTTRQCCWNSQLLLPRRIHPRYLRIASDRFSCNDFVKLLRIINKENIRTRHSYNFNKNTILPSEKELIPWNGPYRI